ncbi:hypothetical protein [Desulfococcus sp.]|uniref:hypothetical protein n=1 Tax=Desulfococcus sp. TaxID=2025834 RepID=UPI0035940865
MAFITKSEIIDPGRLGQEERRRFIQELYAVQCRIFEGVDLKSFTDYIFRPDAARTRVKIFRNDQKKLVGYYAIHLFEVKPSSSEITAFFRAEAGLLRSCRRRHATLPFALTEYCRYKWLHPVRKVYYLGTLVHPSSYLSIFRNCIEIYPSYRRETPPDILRFMFEAAKMLGVGPACRDDPLVVRVGWKVRNDKTDLSFWSHCDQPDVKYFLKRNPGYHDGEGLLTLVPVTWKNLLWLLIRWTTEAFRRRRRKPA